MSLRAQRLLHSLCCLALVSAAAHAGPRCPEIFARLGPRSGEILPPPVSRFKLDRRGFEEIKKFCRDQWPSEKRVGMGGTPIEPFPDRPPEFLFYLVAECLKSTKGDFGLLLEHTLQEMESTVWKRLGAARPSLEGVSPQTRKAWKRSLGDIMDEMNDPDFYVSSRTERSMNVLRLLAPLSTEEEMKEWIQPFRRFLASRLSVRFIDVHEPKLYQFAKQLIRKEAGLPYLPLSEVVVERTPEGDRVLTLLSVDPIERITGQARFESIPVFGIWTASAGKFKIPEKGRAGELIFEKTLRWRTSGTEFSAQVSVRGGKAASKIAPSIARLDYAGMWGDGKLTGLMLPGANMGVGEGGAAAVMDEYRAYFVEQGFRFAKPQATLDFKTFMGNEVSSGRLDYWFKEAHAEGSNRSISQIVNEGAIVTGRRKLGGDREEVIHLFYPDEDRLQSLAGLQEIKYSEFSAWMGKREKVGGGQVFYLDTSCFGLEFGCLLVSATQDSRLVVAGSTESVTTFANDEAASLKHILDGIRSGESFSEIRDRMEIAARETGERLDAYQFPDTPIWRRKVQQGGGRVVEIGIKNYREGRLLD